MGLRAAVDPFVGRRELLEELAALVQRAAAGRGELVLLAGEPGIGKTRLAEEAAAHAESKGTEVLLGNCWEGEGAPPFWPWIQLIRAYLSSRDRETIANVVGPESSDIARIAPEIAEYFPRLDSPLQLEPEQARFRLFDAVATFLTRASAARPLMLVIDDLHWADLPSLRLLDFISHQLRNSRLFVLGAYRDTEVASGSPLAATLRRLTAFRRIPLQGLSETDVGHLLTLAAGKTPQKAFVSSMHERTRGNPLFVKEFVRLLASHGRMAAVSGATLKDFVLPQRVREVLDRRLVHISEDCAEVLAAASVIGPEFDIEGLMSVVGRDRSRVQIGLAEALEAGLIREVERAPGQYGFTHALIRDALYEGLTTVRRASLHRSAGEFLAREFRANLDPAIPELANHFLRAIPHGDSHTAIEFAERAGLQSLTMLAYEEAADYFSRALSVLEQLDSPDEAFRLRLLSRLGDALNGAGETERARDTFLSAATLARKLGSADELARSALGFGRWLQYAGYAGSDKTLIGLLEQALDLLGPEDIGLRVHVLARLAYETVHDHERSRSLIKDALEMANRLGDPAARAVALKVWHDGIVATVPPAERVVLADEIIRLGKETGDIATALQGRVFRVTDLIELGDIQAVDLEIDTFTRIAEEARLPTLLWFPAVWKAMRALLQGRFASAEELAAHAIEIGRGQGEIATQYFGIQLMMLRWEQGRIAELIPAISAGAEENLNQPTYRCALAVAHAEAGHDAAARAEFNRLAADGFASIPRDFTWVNSLALLAEASYLLEDRERAQILYQLCLPHASSYAFMAWGAVCLGSVQRYLGLLASTEGRWAEAESHFKVALEKNGRIGAAPATAHTQHNFARMLLRREEPGDRERAQEFLERGLSTARELGMKGLEAKILEVLPRAGGMAAASDINTFRKEGDYWTLAFSGKEIRLKDAKGLRDIAAMLSVPQKEIHVADLIAGSEGGAVGLATKRSGEVAEFVLDARARAEYRSRLADLQEDLDEAERDRDSARAANARAEMDFIAAELASALGLGGRPRRAGDPAERARKAVTQRIRNVIRRIEPLHPTLGKHLANSIRTGTFCSYSPEHPTDWLF